MPVPMRGAGVVGAGPLVLELEHETKAPVLGALDPRPDRERRALLEGGTEQARELGVERVPRRAGLGRGIGDVEAPGGPERLASR